MYILNYEKCGKQLRASLKLSSMEKVYNRNRTRSRSRTKGDRGIDLLNQMECFGQKAKHIFEKQLKARRFKTSKGLAQIFLLLKRNPSNSFYQSLNEQCIKLNGLTEGQWACVARDFDNIVAGYREKQKMVEEINEEKNLDQELSKIVEDKGIDGGSLQTKRREIIEVNIGLVNRAQQPQTANSGQSF